MYTALIHYKDNPTLEKAQINAKEKTGGDELPLKANNFYCFRIIREFRRFRKIRKTQAIRKTRSFPL